MTFLNPLVLIGLIAAAIPIILHLLNLRKLRTIEFSSVRFLKELQRTRMRRVRIRQLLLLLARTLLIVALVLAFSRPAVRTSLAGLAGGRAATTMVVLLDDSPSMGVRNEQGVLFQQAQERAAQVAALAEPGDQFFLLRLSETGREGDILPARTPDAVRSALGAMTLSLQTAPYRRAVAAAERLLAATTNANRELYLITDGQATQFLTPPGTRDTAVPVSMQTRAFTLMLRAGKADNAGVTALEVPTRMVAQGRPLEVRSTVWNYGAAPLHNEVVSLYLDGARVMQQALDITPQASAVALLRASPRRRGVLSGAAAIDDDALEADNRRYFALNVPDNIRVLLVGGTDAETRLPALALTLGGDSTMTSLFSVRRVVESALAGADVDAFDAVVLCDVHRFSPAEADRLAQFARNGGGLLIFPGTGADLANYNQTLFARLGIPPAADAPRADVRSGSFLSFDKVDLAHPLFAGLFDQPAGKRRMSGLAESPRVIRSITPAAGENGTPIITLTNGAGFLTEYRTGQGKALLCSVDAGVEWSDFPLKGLFAPLMHRMMVYLAEQTQIAPSFVAGERLRFSLRLKDRSAAGPFVFRSPSGLDERIVPAAFSASGVAAFETGPAQEIGIYQLYPPAADKRSGSTARPLQAVAVNVSPAESDLRAIDDAGLAAFWSAAGVPRDRQRTMGPDATPDAVIRNSRYGMELWKHFLALAIILALVEMALGREAKQEKE